MLPKVGHVQVEAPLVWQEHLGEKRDDQREGAAGRVHAQADWIRGLRPTRAGTTLLGLEVAPRIGERAAWMRPVIAKTVWGDRDTQGGRGVTAGDGE